MPYNHPMPEREPLKLYVQPRATAKVFFAEVKSSRPTVDYAKGVKETSELVAALRQGAGNRTKRTRRWKR
jgi:hypothetical protein